MYLVNSLLKHLPHIPIEELSVVVCLEVEPQIDGKFLKELEYAIPIYLSCHSVVLTVKVEVKDILYLSVVFDVYLTPPWVQEITYAFAFHGVYKFETFTRTIMDIMIVIILIIVFIVLIIASSFISCVP